MPHFRAFYSHPWADGCVDGEAANMDEFLGKVWEKLDHNFGDRAKEADIEQCFEYNPKLCPKCGKEMINLGLIYDECNNRDCELYNSDPRPFMK